MAAASEEPKIAGSSRGDLSPHTRARLRAALTGSIFAMSVLAYLGDHETSLGPAVLTVVGTGVVIFFGEAYAGLFSMALATVRSLPAEEIREELSACSTAAAPGVAAGLFLLVADLFGLGVQAAIDVALWLGVLTLVLCSAIEARDSHRSLPVRAGWVVVSVLVGVGIIALKARLH
ncbi:hypothetical protein LQ327_17815 [Actinomycetospora endophytica]|uniref:VIT family protein n=1 Tax=Actinomycetospora endophytica TaxID=2291215 RepID=A0ABS8PAH9_9PSEU|nr:hypothetical protein [Actinomycetospora endophytica]MCD2195228.1 hypothetical protein [Actinomycetospora endophytica]